jgi:hypothetical protein
MVLRVDGSYCFSQIAFAPYAHPGQWNDPNMLESILIEFHWEPS